MQSLESAADDEALVFREARTGQAGRGGSISRFSRTDQIVSGRHELTDYDFEKPSADLMARFENALGHSNSEQARYSYPGNYIEHARGDALAKIRNREDQAHAHVI